MSHQSAVAVSGRFHTDAPGPCVSMKMERDSCRGIRPKAFQCWPQDVSDQTILKRILWPELNPNSVSWPHAYWQLLNSCVEVCELRISDVMIRSVNLRKKSIRSQVTDREVAVQSLKISASELNDNEESHTFMRRGLWQLSHSCVDVQKLDETHKINVDGSVKLRRQMVQVFPISDEFVCVKPMKANKVVPVTKPAERKEIFDLDAVKELYTRRSTKFHCDKCGKAYSRKSSLNYHVKDKHMHITRFRCGDCDRCFLSKSQFTVHVARHKKKKRSQCRKCLKRFFCVSDRNKHMRSCFKAPQFRCKICLKWFQSRESLRCHVMHKVSRRRFKCGICAAKFSHYASLHKHLKSCRN